MFDFLCFPLFIVRHCQNMLYVFIFNIQHEKDSGFLPKNEEKTRAFIRYQETTCCLVLFSLPRPLLHIRSLMKTCFEHDYSRTGKTLVIRRVYVQGFGCQDQIYRRGFLYHTHEQVLPCHSPPCLKVKASLLKISCGKCLHLFN